jgi:phosphatidylserine decarboxylase
LSLSVLMQYLLPHRLLSALARKLAYSRWRPWKNWLIRLAVAKFRIDLEEAAQPDPEAYASFNAFFTRALKAGARERRSDPSTLLQPADGIMSQCGAIESGRIFQAKGQAFTAAELLGDEAMAAPYAEGSFANIYLSPRDYHRVHMPWSGRLVETLHVPGRLYSVAPWAVRAIPRLFARNERLVCHFETDFGPMCVVMVGALLVSAWRRCGTASTSRPTARSPGAWISGPRARAGALRGDGALQLRLDRDHAVPRGRGGPGRDRQRVADPAGPRLGRVFRA